MACLILHKLHNACMLEFLKQLVVHIFHKFPQISLIGADLNTIKWRASNCNIIFTPSHWICCWLFNPEFFQNTYSISGLEALELIPRFIEKICGFLQRSEIIIRFQKQKPIKNKTFSEMSKLSPRFHRIEIIRRDIFKFLRNLCQHLGPTVTVEAIYRS